MKNTTYTNDSGFTVIVADTAPIRAYVAQGRTERLERNALAYNLYVCGFGDEINNFTRFNLSATPHVTLFASEREAKAFCQNKVIHYHALPCVSEGVVNQYVQANRVAQESHRLSLTQ